jgi:predicted dehydrogenase
MINNILVIGLGSIGRRHLNNLISLGAEDISVVTSKEIKDDYPNVKVYRSLNEALSKGHPKWVWICTPTAFHEESLIPLLKNNIANIYLEKPVSHSDDNLENLISIAEQSKSRIGVGYDIRFDPGISKVKQLIADNTIGNLINVNAYVGQYLPDWRPHEDYRSGMSAQKVTGGGVMLDLIHELDYLNFICGETKSVACNYVHSGSLEIETEDSADILIRYKNGVSGVIHLDYLQRILRRYCTFTGSNGTIHLDLAKREIHWTTEEAKMIMYSYSTHDRNDRFLDITKAFISGDESVCSLKEGIHSLKQVLAAKKSSEENLIITL